MKICTTCKQNLPLADFHKDNVKSKDGYQSRCKKCETTRARERWYNLGIYKPYNTSKSCSQYLGVHIVERLLFNVFTNVVRMSMSNRGYDFICGKGFKVDVKSACLHTYLDKSGHRTSTHWKFNIRRNKIADYFACVALDNRVNLVPSHFWIIPAGIINNKNVIEISLGTISKWSQYEQPLDKVLSACDVMKATSEAI